MKNRYNINLPVYRKRKKDLQLKIGSCSILMLLILSVEIQQVGLRAQPLAEGEDKFLGCCIGNTIPTSFGNYWNQVTPENAGKWSSVEGIRDMYNWNTLDNIYYYAVNNGFEYKHHTLIWGNQQPSWITGLNVNEQREEIEEWIRLVGERYGDMDFVDVVNEPFWAPPAYMEALGGTGTTGWDWVITSFELARQYCAPGVKLILNEYNILHSNTNTDNYLALIGLLMERGLIDGIGIQGHYFEFKSYAGAPNYYEYSISTIQNNLDRLAETGLPIYITEFDINEEDDNIQLQNYQTYFPLFWEHPAVKGITLWGYEIYATWKPNAYLIDERRAERPALQWLRSYILSPAKPLIISPNGTTVDPQNITLLWHSSESATSYHLQVSTSMMFLTNIVDMTVADTSALLATLNPNLRYYWHVSALNDNGESDYSLTASFMTGDLTSVDDDFQQIPAEFKLFQNYPNPFNPSTQISYFISETTNVKLDIYEFLGRYVQTLVNRLHTPGNYSITFNAHGLSNGIYFYKLTAGSFVDVKKMLLIK